MTKSDSSARHPASAEELGREFAVVDRDADGRVSFAEFRQLLEGLDSGMSEEEMRIGFGEVDTDRDGRIDCQEFIQWWSED